MKKPIIDTKEEDNTLGLLEGIKDDIELILERGRICRATKKILTKDLTKLKLKLRGRY